VSDASEFLPKLGATFNLTPDRSLSLTYSEGFRSGGAGINGSSGLSYVYAPEYVDNLELAYRDAFADGRVRLAANIYTGDWSDQQVEVQLDPMDFSSTRIENAAESKIAGFEVAIDADLTNEITAFASLGRADTKFESFDANAIVDFSGLPFPQAPESTATIGLDYRHVNGIFFGIDIRFVDEYLARDYQNAPIDIVGDYTVANLRVGYRTDEWSVTLFADNVADEEYFVYQDVIGTVDCCATLGARRIVGLAGRWTLSPP
jgi:outer membrane receptor protein involved in Fe transport